MKKVLSLVCVLLLCAALIPAAVAEEAAYTETVVSIPNGDHDIPATVCVPNGEGKFPAVVMLHGTGSNRDEAGNGYKMAAPVLAEKYGIATVRIDFMGSGDSTADYTGYTFESAVSDAAAAAAYMQTLENIDADKIGVMGWSQGGTDALQGTAGLLYGFPAQTDRNIAFLHNAGAAVGLLQQHVIQLSAVYVIAVALLL